MIGNGKGDGPKTGRVVFPCLATIALGLWLDAATAHARPTDASQGERFSYELRTQVFASSFRRSHTSMRSRFSDDAERDFYFWIPTLGLRIVAMKGHALLLDGEYRVELGPVISTDGRDPVLLRFGVAHLGYAYRFIARGPRNASRKRRWAISPHVALALGAARARDDYPESGIPKRSPTVGVRAGLNLDVHVRRVFLGWCFSYEVLRHTKGSLERSSFFTWSVLPLFRIGVNLGRPVTGRRSHHP